MICKKVTASKMIDRKFYAGLIAGVIATTAISQLVSNPSNAAPSKPRETPASAASVADTEFKAGTAAVERGEYETSLKHFQAADRAKADDPSTINMIAYSMRKLGRLDEARETYLKALSIRPDFPEAREYLGENYLMLALRELKTLDGYGEVAKVEQKMLRDAFAKFATQAADSRPAKSSSAAN